MATDFKTIISNKKMTYAVILYWCVLNGIKEKNNLHNSHLHSEFKPNF